MYIANELGFYTVAKSKGKYKEARFLPESEFDLETEMHIYDDKIGYLFSKKDEIYGAIIKDEGLAKTQRSVFDMLWKYSKNFDISVPENFDIEKIENEVIKPMRKNLAGG